MVAMVMTMVLVVISVVGGDSDNGSCDDYGIVVYNSSTLPGQTKECCKQTTI